MPLAPIANTHLSGFESDVGLTPVVLLCFAHELERAFMFKDYQTMELGVELSLSDYTCL